MIAAIYARKSTEQNGTADEDKSVTRQIEHAKAYAVRKGWTVDDRFVFVDDGISGAEFTKRPGFVRLMNALKPARFQRLILSDLDRLGRDTIQTPLALRQLLDAGVRIYCYLDDRELAMETSIDTFLVQVHSFVASLEREKGAQRTTDALLRKAKAGHVTGGSCYGYTNVRTERGHVERIINQDEAVVVRRIFALCVAGFGQIAITKKLNAERAPAPRSQQGRPRAWSSSSVREVLYRDLYRGESVWNRTRKRDARGKVHQQARPETDWIRVKVPQLRIVSDDLWNKAHARLARTREAYLTTTGGRLWGRPLDGAARKYLLAGLARCGQCGGSLEVRSRDHGKQRAFYYSCSSYYRRGPTVCANRLEIPLLAADDAVIEELQKSLLTPAFVDAVVTKVLTRARPTGPDLDADRARMTAQLSEVRGELNNLVDGLAKTGSSPAVTTAIRKREAQLSQLEHDLLLLDRGDEVSQLETAKLAALARTKAMEWRGLLKRHSPQARQIVSKMLRDKLVFRPERRKGVQGYRFTGEGTITELLTGLVPDFLRAVASPAGFEPAFWP